jgi:hypothetical protein
MKDAELTWSTLDTLVALGQRLLGTAVAVGLMTLIYLALRQEHAPRFETLVPVQGRLESATVGPVRGRPSALWLDVAIERPGEVRTYRFRAAAGDADAQRARVRPPRDRVTLWVKPGFEEAASTPIAYQIHAGTSVVLAFEDARDAQEGRRRWSLLVLAPAAAVLALYLWWLWRR